MTGPAPLDAHRRRLCGRTGEHPLSDCHATLDSAPPFAGFAGALDEKAAPTPEPASEHTVTSSYPIAEWATDEHAALRAFHDHIHAQATANSWTPPGRDLDVTAWLLDDDGHPATHDATQIRLTATWTTQGGQT